MRLGGWRSKAPGKDGLNQKVLELVGTILASLGAEADPHCWIIWGDEAGSRWTLMAPCPAGLATVNVRAGGGGEGSRAGGRLIRWSKVQVGELAAETERGHRLVMFQVEGQPIRGTDDNADDVAAFAGLTLAGLEGRPLPNLDKPARRSPASAAGAGSTPAAGRPAKGAAKGAVKGAATGAAGSGAKALSVRPPSRSAS
jgi:hypothetical protein